MHPLQRRFAARLCRLREERGLTQLALATACGWSVQKISLYERCRRNPTLTDLVALSQALEVPVTELLAEGAAPDDAVGQHLESLRRLLRDQSPSTVQIVLRMVQAFLSAGAPI